MTEINKNNLSELRHTIVALTRNLILIPSSTGRDPDISRVLAFVQNHIDLADIETNHYQQNGHPSIVLLPKGITKPKIMLNGHLDVVALPNAQYHSEIKDGKIIGPGAGDMKGAIAVMCEVFRNLHINYPGISLGLSITTDEEIGGYNGVAYLLKEQKLSCDIAIIPDSGSINKLTIAEKGVLHIEVVAKGIAGHGARPWHCDNAAEILFDYYQSVKQIFSQETHTENHWHPTCAMTVIHTDNNVANRIPDNAMCIFDIRFPMPYTPQRILDALKEICPNKISLKIIMSAHPTEFKPDPLYASITETITGKPVKYVKTDGGSDARFFHEAGIEAILARPIVGNTHTENEWVDIESLMQLYQIYEQYIPQATKTTSNGNL